MRTIYCSIGNKNILSISLTLFLLNSFRFKHPTQELNRQKLATNVKSMISNRQSDGERAREALKLTYVSFAFAYTHTL